MDAQFRSFRTLSVDEATALRPRRIEIVTARPGDTLNSPASRMAFEHYRIDRCLVQNDLAIDRLLRPGEQVRLIVYGTT